MGYSYEKEQKVKRKLQRIILDLEEANEESPNINLSNGTRRIIEQMKEIV